ncbi:MAG: hypothetical protein OEY01_09110 [Desulfobulbaceae bacterium]|nr:hypothetical protein [Desulfobulbaceae bacterium]HIJ79161.1 hypothetical protein [Deltaproteobacteria bacterium]
MQKWEINGNVQWLCFDCAKANAHVFLLAEHQWLSQEKDGTISCDCCRCTDNVVRMFGRWRWFFYPFLALAPMLSTAPSPAMRRAK